jgi:signal transduction histidine kinase
MKTRVLDFYHSYKGKWLIAIFAFCFLMFMLLIIDRITMTNKFIYEREMNRVNSIGMLLTIHVIDHLRAHDTVHVIDALTRTDSEPDIEVASVIDKDRHVLFSSRPGLQGKSDPFRDSSLKAIKGPVFYKSFPISGESGEKEYVQIGYSLKNLQTQLYLSTYRMLAIEFIMFIIILLAAWNITSALLKPLFEMKDASNKIASGDFSIRTPVATHDIIGELGSALNNMAERLGDLTENMNEKILQATGDLSKSNETLRKKTLELESSNRKLMELDTLKSDFVSMVSHDLKTPLTSIIGFAKTLLTLDVSPEQRARYLMIIETEGKRLAQLIGEYLDISKIESGNFSIKKEIVDPLTLVRETIETSAQRLPPGSFTLTMKPLIPPILGDINQLKRVFINILDNALRYNPPGIPIGISVENNAGSVIVSIKDNGPGVRLEDQTKIFDKFYRSPNTINERSSGTGLGLAIAKGIIKAHDGLLWVESEPGEGATFRFSIPAVEQQPMKA